MGKLCSREKGLQQVQATPKVLDFFIIDLLFSGMNYSTIFLFYVLNTGTGDHQKMGCLEWFRGHWIRTWKYWTKAMQMWV